MADTLNIEDKLSDEMVALMEESCRVQPVVPRFAEDSKRESPVVAAVIQAMTPAAIVPAVERPKAEPVSATEPSGATPEQGTISEVAGQFFTAEEPAAGTLAFSPKRGRGRPRGPDSGPKLCKKCNTTKDIEKDFGFHKNPKGEMRPNSYCRDCRGGK